jgi:4-diphosphocytidyl-2-C-methyl-D-erythritol kinase
VYVRQLAGRVEVLAPAKLNLFLEVLARRADGFHEIETLMVPIGLFDSLNFREDSRGRLNLKCQWACGLQKQRKPDESGRSPVVDWEELPEGYDNVAMRAVDLLWRRSGIAAGASLQLTKRIPSAAGLGGGSSDAAAALIAANLAWKLGWPIDRLSQLAGEIGSDVPFFLGAGPALCQGRGERIQPMTGLPSLDFVVVSPSEGLSTAAVYANCRPADAPRTADGLLAAWRSGDRRRLAGAICNRLEEAAESLSPWIKAMRGEFSKLDCIAAQMSGSGTSYFGICRNAGHARLAASRLRSRGFQRVFAVRSL